MERVAVIGAGISGLCTAKHLKRLGYDVTVFDKDPEIGGVWASSRRYPGLTTQNPRDTYAFSDFPMPRDYPEWPTGQQMQRYLTAYAEHFGLIPHIRLGCEVVKVEAVNGETTLEDISGWKLSSKPVEHDAGGDAGGDAADNANSALTEEYYDWLIVCNGIFSIPTVPHYKGEAEFKGAGGAILHTSQFTDLESVRDKNVVIIGYGKSSCDVAKACVGVAKTVQLVVRQYLWKIPKWIGNRIHFKHVLLTRMGEAVFPYIERRGIERFLHGAGKPLRNFAMNMLERTIANQLKLDERGLRPDGPLETIARSTVSMVSDDFFDFLTDGKIVLQKNEIAELTPGAAVLKNGDAIPADYIICGTGWDQQTRFLPEAVLKAVTDHDGNYLLYRAAVPVGVSKLVFNGYNSSFYSQLTAEVGSFWIGEYMAGNLQLPPKEQQRASVMKRLQWMEQRTDGKHCKGTNIVPFSLHHIDALMEDMNMKLPAFLRLRQWLRVVEAHQFEPLVGEAERRSRLSPDRDKNVTALREASSIARCVKGASAPTGATAESFSNSVSQ